MPGAPLLSLKPLIWLIGDSVDCYQSNLFAQSQVVRKVRYEFDFTRKLGERFEPSCRDKDGQVAKSSLAPVHNSVRFEPHPPAPLQTSSGYGSKKNYVGLNQSPFLLVQNPTRSLPPLY